MSVISADAPARWWLSGFAALAAHGAVLLGMPDGAIAPTAAPIAIEMTVVTGPQSGATAEASVEAGGGSSGAIAHTKPRARRRATVAHQRTSDEAHVADVERNIAPALPAGDLAPATAQVGGQEGASAIAGAGTGAGGAGAGSGTGEGSAQGSGIPTTRPALIASRNPCLGYFPAGAHVDHGRVQIQVRVDETGHASVSQVLIEAPFGHDFARAARACTSALRFAPARDALGVAVTGDAKLELHFHRS